jgi:GH15 family glucan-1,4-alpha-glucosidase
MTDAAVIGDYALLGDGHSAALVSRGGSIDWCCMPRFDAGAAFARLLDRGHGGYCMIAPVGDGHWERTREYLEDTLVLRTVFQGASAEVVLIDCMEVSDRLFATPTRRILRAVEVRRGSPEMQIVVAPRFDYGQVRPWIRRRGRHLHTAIGGNDGLVVWCEQELAEDPAHELMARVRLDEGERLRLSLTYRPPELIEREPLEEPDPDEIDRAVETTVRWWRRWSQTVKLKGRDDEGARRSGMVLKALTYAPTGAIVAAPTTSLPEVPGGVRNWDYRYAWVRDSSFSSRAFAEIGCEHEADAFRAFIMRSAAGHAEELQILYGVGGERRVTASELDRLQGYADSRPVRLGNGAAEQLQLDAYGELVNLTWRWHRRGHSPDDDDWRFLVSLIEHAADQCTRPDNGIWEWPGKPDHFVHSKVLCWSALDRGLRLADECMRRAPTRRWTKVRDELRATIERRGFDRKRGTYRQVYDRSFVDAALLLLPTVEYLEWDDDRMLGTIEAVREELDAGDGLLYRYRRADGLPGQEGAFLCCSFWLAEALARAGQASEARAVFDRALAAGNDVGLFSEELDPKTGALLGNFPQGLTHLSHISAAVALAEVASEIG